MAEVARNVMLHYSKEIADRTGLNENLVRYRFREGIYKGERVGKHWVASDKEFNRIIGVDASSSDYAKEMRMRELEARNRELEMRITTLATLLSTASTIINS